MAHPNPKIDNEIQALKKFHQAIDDKTVELNEADNGLIAGQTDDIKKKIEGKYAGLEKQRKTLNGLIKAVTKAHETETNRVEGENARLSEALKNDDSYQKLKSELSEFKKTSGRATSKVTLALRQKESEIRAEIGKEENFDYHKNALQQPMADLYTFINNNRGDAVEILEHCLDEENKKKFFSSMHRILSETNRPFARAFKDNIIKKQTKNTIPKDHTLGSVAGRRIVGAMTLHGYEKGEQGHMTHAFGLEVKHSHDVLHLSIQDVIDAAAKLGLSHQLTVTPTGDGGCKWHIKSGYTSLIRTLRAKSKENKKEVSIEEEKKKAGFTTKSKEVNAGLTAQSGVGASIDTTNLDPSFRTASGTANSAGAAAKEKVTPRLKGGPLAIVGGRVDAQALLKQKVILELKKKFELKDDNQHVSPGPNGPGG